MIFSSASFLWFSSSSTECKTVAGIGIACVFLFVVGLGAAVFFDVLLLPVTLLAPLFLFVWANDEVKVAQQIINMTM
ncbi:MAG: YceK/YidQ family lipoprotein [Tannerella sp.]|nr:YceK/YidQ family lipoprotein [Tannerella sp.]